MHKETKTMANMTATKANAAQAPKMSAREILASTISTMVSDGKAEKIADGQWKFSGIDTGNGAQDYMVKVSSKQGKSGKSFMKRELVRIENGAEKVVELGEFKKQYLYGIVKNLVSPKVARPQRTKIPYAEVLALRDEIKKNKDKFHIDEKGALIGKASIGDIEIVTGAIKPMKNDHKRNFGRKLYVNGTLIHEGSQLNCCFDTFNAKGRVKKATVAKAAAPKADKKASK